MTPNSFRAAPCDRPGAAFVNEAELLADPGPDPGVGFGRVAVTPTSTRRLARRSCSNCRPRGIGSGLRIRPVRIRAPAADRGGASRTKSNPRLLILSFRNPPQFTRRSKSDRPPDAGDFSPPPPCVEVYFTATESLEGRPKSFESLILLLATISIRIAPSAT
jgi:hypothetical protein